MEIYYVEKSGVPAGTVLRMEISQASRKRKNILRKADTRGSIWYIPTLLAAEMIWKLS